MYDDIWNKLGNLNKFIKTFYSKIIVTLPVYAMQSLLCICRDRLVYSTFKKWMCSIWIVKLKHIFSVLFYYCAEKLTDKLFHNRTFSLTELLCVGLFIDGTHFNLPLLSHWVIKGQIIRSRWAQLLVSWQQARLLCLLSSFVCFSVRHHRASGLRKMFVIYGHHVLWFLAT